jgi:Family of unknown function (DUF6221)
MTGLVAFLSARLDEDEAAAKAAWGIEWNWQDLARPFREPSSVAHTVHIARHDPGRVLREVEAKRALLRGHEGVHRCDWGEHRGGEFGPCSRVRILAAIYRDHPDYDEDWLCPLLDNSGTIPHHVPDRLLRPDGFPLGVLGLPAVGIVLDVYPGSIHKPGR